MTLQITDVDSISATTVIAEACNLSHCFVSVSKSMKAGSKSALRFVVLVLSHQQRHSYFFILVLSESITPYHAWTGCVASHNVEPVSRYMNTFVWGQETQRILLPVQLLKSQKKLQWFGKNHSIIGKNIRDPACANRCSTMASDYNIT